MRNKKNILKIKGKHKTDRHMLSFLKEKSSYVRKETIRIHGIAPGTRLASSLSCIEILAVLYYGRIMSFDPNDIFSEHRDRLIISKAHGSISMYPILADLGFFPREELIKVCQQGSFLGSIPDPTVPGYETINGSLGQGLGVACGIALAMKRKKSSNNVFILSGDGELYEGSVWEAIMFAREHKLDNTVLIIDANKACMLDYCKNIIDLEPLKDKFKVFGWDVSSVDGHNIKEVYLALLDFKNNRDGKPKAIIANTIKGKGIERLENDHLSHIRVLSKDEIDNLLSELE